MEERFKIYVEQLRSQDLEQLEEVFPPDFINVNEKDLSFSDPIKLTGQAYLADGDLVLRLDANTTCRIPCCICNEWVRVDLAITGFYHAVPLAEIKTGVYNYQEILRETLILEVPHLAECRGGKCPKREALGRYLKKETTTKTKEAEEGYQPFLDLADKLKKNFK